MYSLVIFILFGARSLSTDDAYIADEGNFELEVGYEFNEVEHSCEISLKHGITSRLDFAIIVPYFVAPDQQIGIAEFCIKYSLLCEGNKIPGISVSFANELGASEYILNGIISKRLGDIGLHLNFIYIPNNKVNCSVAFELPLQKFTFVSEAIYESENSLEVLIGGDFLLFREIVLDLGIGKGFNEAQQEWKIVSGLTGAF